MLHFVVGTIMHGYNMVKYNSVNGANYCKALIGLYLFRHLLTIMPIQEAAVIALKTCKTISSDMKGCKSRSS